MSKGRIIREKIMATFWLWWGWTLWVLGSIIAGRVCTSFLAETAESHDPRLALRLLALLGSLVSGASLLAAAVWMVCKVQGIL